MISVIEAQGQNTLALPSAASLTSEAGAPCSVFGGKALKMTRPVLIWAHGRKPVMRWWHSL